MGWPGVAGRGGGTLDQGGNLELFVDRELADEHTASVSVAGPLDVEAVHRLSKTLMRLLLHATDHRALRLDLSGVTRCDRDGLFMLTGLHAVLDGLGVDFTITKLNEAVQARITSEAMEHRLPLHLERTGTPPSLCSPAPGRGGDSGTCGGPGPVWHGEPLAGLGPSSSQPIRGGSRSPPRSRGRPARGTSTPGAQSDSRAQRPSTLRRLLRDGRPSTLPAVQSPGPGPSATQSSAFHLSTCASPGEARHRELTPCAPVRFQGGRRCAATAHARGLPAARPAPVPGTRPGIWTRHLRFGALGGRVSRRGRRSSAAGGRASAWGTPGAVLSAGRVTVPSITSRARSAMRIWWRRAWARSRWKAVPGSTPWWEVR